MWREIRTALIKTVGDSKIKEAMKNETTFPMKSEYETFFEVWKNQLIIFLNETSYYVDRQSNIEMSNKANIETANAKKLILKLDDIFKGQALYPSLALDKLEKLIRNLKRDLKYEMMSKDLTLIAVNKGPEKIPYDILAWIIVGLEIPWNKEFTTKIFSYLENLKNENQLIIDESISLLIQRFQFNKIRFEDSLEMSREVRKDYRKSIIAQLDGDKLLADEVIDSYILHLCIVADYVYINKLSSFGDLLISDFGQGVIWRSRKY